MAVIAITSPNLQAAPPARPTEARQAVAKQIEKQAAPPPPPPPPPAPSVNTSGQVTGTTISTSA